MHPNADAHKFLVGRAVPAPGGQMCYKLSREADSDEVLTALVHVAAIPVRDSIRILLDDLEQLQWALGHFPFGRLEPMILDDRARREPLLSRSWR